MIAKILFTSLLFLAELQTALAAPVEISSTPQRTLLLELYTSEGCSSCPPADMWFSGFKNDARLWTQIVPVAFHVDYWNSLGWRDRFSDARYSARQRNYYDHHYLKGVYTPGMVTNGREWRDWFGIRRLPQPPTTQVGVLKAVIDNNAASVEFSPSNKVTSPLLLNVALLGFNQTSAVTSGENRGKELIHDFVVVDFRQYPHPVGDAHYRWQLHDVAAEQATGVALWITEGDDPTPIQSAGGWLQP